MRDVDISAGLMGPAFEGTLLPKILSSPFHVSELSLAS